jgi:hypothetical protein
MVEIRVGPAMPHMSDRRGGRHLLLKQKVSVLLGLHYRRTALLPASFAGPGFGIRCLVDPWIRDSE